MDGNEGFLNALKRFEDGLNISFLTIFFKSLKQAYVNDDLAKKVLSGVFKDTPYRYSAVDGLVYYRDSDDRQLLYVPACAQTVPKYQVSEHPVEGDDVRISVTLREELIGEAHEVAGHAGISKVFASLRRYYYWPRLFKHVTSFVRGCTSCQANKYANRTVPGKLKSLQLPHRRWETVSMDWVTGLPQTKSGFDSILVVIDYFSKRAHFIPTTDNSTSADTSNLFYHNIFRHHGLPSRIISDRDRRLTSNFWKTLTKLVGTNLAMSTPYHSQTDGATEILNKTLAAMLRMYTEHSYHDWDDYLTAAEFAYNNSLHRTTGFTPFELDTGQDPLDPISKSFADAVLPDAFRTDTEVNYSAEAESLLMEWRDKLTLAKSNLEDAQNYEATHSKSSAQGSVQFAKGDKVWLNTENLSFYDKKGKIRGRAKFDPRYAGPYTIVEVISENSAFKLDLGPKEKFHPVQSIVKLIPFRHSIEYPLAHEYEAPVAVLATDELDEDVDTEYELEKIIAKRKFGKVWKYRCKWRGFNNRHNTWEPKSSLTHCKEILDEFESRFACFL